MLDLETNVITPFAKFLLAIVRVAPLEKWAAFNIRNVRTLTKGFKIVNHTWSHDHTFDFENPSVIDKGGFRTREDTGSVAYQTPNTDNNSYPLPRQYNILFNKYS